MIQPIDFVRRPFEIQAIRVTNANMAEVSVWCKSPIKPLGEHDGRQGPYIRVKTTRPAHPRQGMAFVGDWVTYTPKGGFKVYTNRAFEDNFMRKDSAKTQEPPKVVMEFVERVDKPVPTPRDFAVRQRAPQASVQNRVAVRTFHEPAPQIRDCNG